MRYRIKKHESHSDDEWIYCFYTVDKKESFFSRWQPIARFNRHRYAMDFLIEIRGKEEGE